MMEKRLRQGDGLYIGNSSTGSNFLKCGLMYAQP